MPGLLIKTTCSNRKNDSPVLRELQRQAGIWVPPSWDLREQDVRGRAPMVYRPGTWTGLRRVSGGRGPYRRDTKCTIPTTTNNPTYFSKDKQQPQD